MLRRVIILVVTIYSAFMLLYCVVRWIIPIEYRFLALLHTFAPYLFLPLLITIPLALLVRRPRLAAIQAVPLLIALLWLVPMFLPKNTVEAQQPSLRLVMFNIMGMANPYSLDQTWLIEQDADVVVLVETARSVFDMRMLRLYLRYPHTTEIRGSIRVFSRIPFEQVDYIWIEEQSESLPGRLIMRLQMRWEGQAIALYAVHLNLPEQHIRQPGQRVYTVGFPLNFMLDYDESRRNNQIEVLLDTLSAEPLPYIVTGDYNMSSYSLVYDEIAKVMIDSHIEAGLGTGHTYPVGGVSPFPERFPSLLRLDYVWHNAKWRTLCIETGPPLQSDHLPLVADLVID